MPITNISGPLDFWNILVNELAGDIYVFVFLSVAIILFLAAKFRMPSLIMVMLIALWLLLLATTGITWLTVFVGLGMAVFVAWQFAKLIQR